jgi:hypothetical protein
MAAVYIIGSIEPFMKSHRNSTSAADHYIYTPHLDGNALGADCSWATMVWDLKLRWSQLSEFSMGNFKNNLNDAFN